MMARFGTLSGQLVLWLRDLLDALLGRRQPMVPPRRLMYDGPQDKKTFVENGREFLHHYVELCELQPSERVIEIGSGMGRKAVPLTSYLSNRGSYLGFEINQAGVEWCQREISSRFPNFRFEHVDVFNGRYNPRGALTAREVRFPVPDGDADLIVLASVFTHMFFEDVAHYLMEIARLLEPKRGRCLISYFLLGDAARRKIADGHSSLTFQYERQGCYVERLDRPEDAVAYEEAKMIELYEKSGLRIVRRCRGSWAGWADSRSYQDLILAKKC